MLGIANTCSVITRSFVPLLQIEQADFFKLISDAGINVIERMRDRANLK